jgi:hypothetical protein
MTSADWGSTEPNLFPLVMVYGTHQRFNLTEGGNFNNRGVIQLWNRSDHSVHYRFEDFRCEEVSLRGEGLGSLFQRLPPGTSQGFFVMVNRVYRGAAWESHPGWEPGPDGWDMTGRGFLALMRHTELEVSPHQRVPLHWYLTVPKGEDAADGRQFYIHFHIEKV